MRSVKMNADHNQPMTPQATRHYLAGRTYHNVLEEHARAIEDAGNGKIIPSAEGAKRGGEHGNAAAETGARRRRGQAKT